MASPRIRLLLWASAITASFAAGYLSGSFFPVPYGADDDAESELRMPSGSYTRPLLDCEIHDYSKDFPTPLSFHLELEEFGKNVERRPGIETVAIYFRDLDNGPWIGYREGERFTPASLYKVPVALACLKRAVENPEFMNMRAVFPGLPLPEMGQYHYPPKEQLVQGREYAVVELLRRMLIYSDNGAAWMLTQAVGQKEVDAVLADLGINPGDLQAVQTTLSPEEFGRFFRVLYNASYLPPPVSEGTLEVLSQNTFTEGLVAGLPVDIAVSHKHGEKMKLVEGIRNIQLHDCGIVYHPKRPYLLSVMTLGSDYEAQAKAISDVSRFVFDEVTRRTL